MDTSSQVIAAALDQVGPRLRRLRDQRGLTLIAVGSPDQVVERHPAGLG